MRKAVLLVEDDIDIREHAKIALEMENYEVLTAGNGLEALSVLSSNIEHLPFCILLDVSMPVMNGLEFLGKLRKHHNPNVANLPTIIATARGSSVPHEDLALANKILKKPFELDELYSAIKQFE